ncbi:GmrSD restriction endonuclease domain-containing protein [Gordonia neofelifaecis]|uniref:Excalibur calcium-binding domain-containing protein n=1 Tax=Gordonia neofelifaecis NRRL B-59395 TaxID=644548 RepID=F1YKT4_9ACTN|nr:DUF1524 domain-containing protein [Gordonia neofelifaecis]EGD54728.1 hypothetical protein SCNU_12597 [Gordonia neofelifaecis NRRL B-59395]
MRARHRLFNSSGTATRLGASAVAVLAATLIGGCDAGSSTPAEPSTTSVDAASDRGDLTWPSTSVATEAAPAAPSGDAAAALAELDTLAVKGRAPKTGYSRSLFGQAWTDDVNVGGGHNGCDTRNDILTRDLTGVTYKARTRNCVVLTGTLQDAYTGRTIPFQRGERTSSAVQIDHLVALSDAWQKGAQLLSTEERTDLANDPRNLQAVDGPTNQRKSDGDAATWLPPNKSYRCTYVSRQIAVKAAYRLWVTAAEKSAMQRVLSSCGGTPTTEEPAVDTPTTTPPAYTPPATTRAPLVEQPAPAAPSDVYYKNCSAVRAAGAAPLLRGQPGYSSKLDRDGDGVACE